MENYIDSILMKRAGDGDEKGENDRRLVVAIHSMIMVDWDYFSKNKIEVVKYNHITCDSSLILKNWPDVIIYRAVFPSFVRNYPEKQKQCIENFQNIINGEYLSETDGVKYRYACETKIGDINIYRRYVVIDDPKEDS